MRKPTTRELTILVALRKCLVRGMFSAKTLSGPEVSEATIEKEMAGDKGMYRALARFGAMYEAAHALDGTAAAEMAEQVLRAAGIRGSFVLDQAEAEAAEALMVESVQAGAAMGEVQAAVLEAASDGHVSSDEAGAIASRVRRAWRRLAGLFVLAQQAEEREQPALALGSRR